MNESYEIIRSYRKTIAIQIKADGRILVRCPQRMHGSEVQRFVESKTSWIDKHLSHLKCADNTPYSKEEIDRLRTQTKKLVTKRAAYYASIMGVTFNRITVRAQRTRWGSCSTKGNLNFNCLLALVPPDVLDYVVVHELCHLKQMNHSACFWTEVQKILPDFAESRLWLKQNGSVLIYRI